RRRCARRRASLETTLGFTPGSVLLVGACLSSGCVPFLFCALYGPVPSAAFVSPTISLPVFFNGVCVYDLQKIAVTGIAR
ncbi:hypothetical protein QMN58_24945, partial [Escherichia coli]|nr:hypothetical protein [Escherichia coli]